MGFSDIQEEQQGAATAIPDSPPDIDFLRRMYREYYSSTQQQRDLAFRDADYFHGKQLTPEIKAELARRRQPELTLNKVGPAINGVLGLLDSNQTDPEAIGRNDDDESAAQVVTQVLRYLSDRSDFSDVKAHASKDYLIFGTMAALTTVDDRGNALTQHIPFREFFFDPYSLRHDFRDARYLGHARWVDADRAQAHYPDARERLGDIAVSDFSGSGGAECQPDQRQIWLDGSRKRVLIVEVHYLDGATGTWKQAIYCHAGLLHYSSSPYMDDEQNSVCPITALSFEVDEQGQRYGMIRDMVKLQDAINNNLSKQTNFTNTAQVEQSDPQANPVDRETARQEASRPDGVMPAGYKRIPLSDVFQGVNIALDRAVDEIERKAPSPALLGRAGGANESGRARQILQQAGFTELARAFTMFERWERRTYEQMWFRAVQFMDDQRIILVTDDEGARQKLTLNQPVYAQQIVHVPDGAGNVVPTVQNVVVDMNHRLATMEMDITIKTVRQADTLRGEAVQNMLEWSAKTGVSVLAPEFELIIEMSDIPQKPYILAKYKKLRAAAEAQQAQGAQAQQMAAQQAQATAQAATQSKILRDQAQAERDHSLANKHSVEAASDSMDLAVKQAMIQHLGDISGLN